MALDLARTDTICAVATAPGHGALSVVRVSGRLSHDVLARVFRPRRARSPRDFVVILGDVVREGPDGHARVIDEALAVRFPEGRSYTGERAFELTVHGGASRARAVIDTLVEAGCRLAEPGEFTLRAVLTGRMDLVAADAVVDVIHARSEAAADVALRALRGELGAKLEGVRALIVSALAELEARLDFPDEDLPPEAGRALDDDLARAHVTLSSLVAGGLRGRRLVEGARVVLFGAPNAGKSTLFNALVGEERAIVHAMAGTTRDVLEHEVVLGGVPVVMVDVAGVREADALDPVEEMGIARAAREAERADLVLSLRDGSDEASAHLPVTTTAPVVHVVTKADRLPPRARTDDGAIFVSATHDVGLDAVRAAIVEHVAVSAHADEALLTRRRQIEEAARARDAVTSARDALAAGAPHEVVASELRAAGGALDRLLGRDLDEDVLDEIFRRFCIGK